MALTAVFSAIGGLANGPEHSASGEWRGDGAARITELLEENRQKVTLRSFLVPEGVRAGSLGFM